MKTRLIITILLACFTSKAQFINVPFYGNCVTNYGIPTLVSNAANTATVPLGGFTNQFNINPASVTNFLIGSALSNSGPTIIQIPPASGLSFMAGMVATNNLLSASNVTFYFNLSVDGTNWSVLNPISAAFALGPANAMLVAGQKVVGYTNFPRTVLDNARYARLDNIMNQNSNHVYVSNMVFGVFR